MTMSETNPEVSSEKDTNQLTSEVDVSDKAAADDSVAVNASEEDTHNTVASPKVDSEWLQQENIRSSAVIPQKEPLKGPIPKGDKVVTAYGEGKVEEYRENEDSYVITLNWQLAGDSIAKAFIPAGNVTWQKKLFQMTVDERVERAKQYKDEGNAHFKESSFMSAIQKYELALVFMRQLARKCNESELSTIVIPCICNTSLCYFQLRNFSEAHTKASEALALDPTNEKALYYRIKASHQKGDFKGAFHEAAEALKVHPNSKNLRAEATSIRRAIRDSKRKTKEMFQGVFGSSKSGSTSNEDVVDESVGHKRNSISMEQNDAQIEPEPKHSKVGDAKPEAKSTPVEIKPSPVTKTKEEVVKPITATEKKSQGIADVDIPVQWIALGVVGVGLLVAGAVFFSKGGLKSVSSNKSEPKSFSDMLDQQYSTPSSKN